MPAPSMRTCRTCEYRNPSLNGSNVDWCIGPQRERMNSVKGLHTVPATCESERFWLWRRLGFDTCGPEANYWHPLNGEAR